MDNSNVCQHHIIKFDMIHMQDYNLLITLGCGESGWNSGRDKVTTGKWSAWG